MAASFIPPTTDLGASAVPPISTAIPTTTTEPAPEAVAHTIPAAPGQPRPVAPAEDIGVPPAKALDAVAEPSILDKAREVTKPVSLVLLAHPFFSSSFSSSLSPYPWLCETTLWVLYVSPDSFTRSDHVQEPRGRAIWTPHRSTGL